MHDSTAPTDGAPALHGWAEPSGLLTPSTTHVQVSIPAGEIARAGLVVIGLGLGLLLLWKIHEVIFLMFLAILLATAIEPIVNRLRRGPFSRGTGTLAVYTAIVLLLGVVSAVTFPSITAQSDEFVQSIPQKIANLRPYAEQLRPAPLREAAVRAITRVGESVRNPQVPVDEGSLIEAFATAGHYLINFATVFFLAFYWMVERASIKRALLRLVPPARAKDVNAVWLEVEEKLGGWVRGQLLVMVVMAIMATAGFFVIGLPSPVLLGVLAGLADIVPMIGPFLAFTPAVFVALGVDPWTALLVVGYAIVIQQIESNYIVPRVMGHTVGVSPLTVLLGILIGAILYGLPGAFLAVPIAGAIQVILAHVLGMEDAPQAAAHTPAAAHDAVAEAVAGAAATAPTGQEAQAAVEAASEARGESPTPGAAVDGPAVDTPASGTVIFEPAAAHHDEATAGPERETSQPEGDSADVESEVGGRAAIARSQ